MLEFLGEEIQFTDNQDYQTLLLIVSQMHFRNIAIKGGPNVIFDHSHSTHTKIQK